MGEACRWSPLCKPGAVRQGRGAAGARLFHFLGIKSASVRWESLDWAETLRCLGSGYLWSKVEKKKKEEKKPGQVVLPLRGEMFSYLTLGGVSRVRISHLNQCFSLQFHSPTHVPTLPLQTIRGLLRAKRTVVSYSHKSPRHI